MTVGLYACGGSSTSPSAANPAAPSAAQATATGQNIGILTIAALRSGATPLGVLNVRSGDQSRVSPRAFNGTKYSTIDCPLGGRVDAIYTRDYVPSGNDIDLAAIRLVFTDCAFTTGGVPFQLNGTLTLSGHYFGSQGTPDIHLSGSLTTSTGPCAVDGTVSVSGAFGGNACGTSMSATPATPPVNLTGTWSGGTLTVSFQHIGSSLIGTTSGFPASFDLTQTSSSTLTFSGILRIDYPGPCSPARMPGSLIVSAANTMTGTFADTNTDCLPETNPFVLLRQ